MPAAVVTGGIVVLAAWVIGPRLPGATDPPLIDTSEQGGGVTEVLSPLVDIRSRLVNRSSTELFSVTATAPAYWRATALPEFDGNTWGLPDRSLDDVEGELQERLPGSVDNRQEIVIAGLGGPLVPAAAEPIAASGEDLRWNGDTSTLVRVDGPLASGDRVEVVSAVPVLTPDQLRATASSAPPDPIYLDLPANFPESVREQAQELTAGAATSYDAALTLQDWFRTQFTYSIEVPQGHGNDAIEAFLRQRVGYCEQFAGTFAAMARSIGIPARVAVGFTPGLTQGDGSRVVLGRNAHAWPEVWFDGIGWVPFEPTPGRGAPGTESYTGVPPAQDESVPQPGQAATPQEVAPPPTTVAPPPTIPQSDIVVPEPVFDPVTPPVRVTVPTTPVALYAVIVATLVATDRGRHPGGCTPLAAPPPRPGSGGAAQPPVVTGDRCGRSHRVPRRPVTHADRAGAGGVAPTAGGRPAAQVAGRADHASGVLDGQGRRRVEGPDDRRRGRAAPLGPPGGAHRHRLDDRRRPRQALLHRLALTASAVLVRSLAGGPATSLTAAVTRRRVLGGCAAGRRRARR